MFLSIGSPGWILFSMPSMAAIVIALKARYGLQMNPGSGIRFAWSCGFSLYIGMRMAAERFRLL